MLNKPCSIGGENWVIPRTAEEFLIIHLVGFGRGKNNKRICCVLVFVDGSEFKMFQQSISI